MFKSPYDTTACRQYADKEHKVSTAIRQQSIVHEITRSVGKNLQILLPDETTIPAFGHPVRVDFNDRTVFVGDTRACTRYDRANNFSITSAGDYQLWLQRLVLQWPWEMKGASTIYQLGQFQTMIFSRWIGDNITRRFGLDVDAQLKIHAIAAYYFYSINDEVEEEFYSEAEVRNIASMMSRYTLPKTDALISVMEEVPIMRNINDLVQAISKYSGSVRLSAFNVAALYQIIGGSWFGSNAREIVAVAIEHPPTFACLLYNALTNRTYKAAGLSQIVKPLERHEQAASFKANFDLMLMEYLDNA